MKYCWYFTEVTWALFTLQSVRTGHLRFASRICFPCIFPRCTLVPMQPFLYISLSNILNCHLVAFPQAGVNLFYRKFIPLKLCRYVTVSASGYCYNWILIFNLNTISVGG